MKGKRIPGTAACLIAAALGLVSLGQSCASSEENESRSLPVVGTVRFQDIRDGTYEAAEYYYGMCDAKVRVSVRGGRVESIRLLKHFHFPFLSGAKVLKRVIEAQSLQVDTVSGATGSSIIVLKAVENAVRMGLPEGK